MTYVKYMLTLSWLSLQPLFLSQGRPTLPKCSPHQQPGSDYSLPPDFFHHRPLPKTYLCFFPPPPSTQSPKLQIVSRPNFMASACTLQKAFKFMSDLFKFTVTLQFLLGKDLFFLIRHVGIAKKKNVGFIKYIELMLYTRRHAEI